MLVVLQPKRAIRKAIALPMVDLRHAVWATYEAEFVAMLRAAYRAALEATNVSALARAIEARSVYAALIAIPFAAAERKMAGTLPMLLLRAVQAVARQQYRALGITEDIVIKDGSVVDEMRNRLELLQVLTRTSHQSMIQAVMEHAYVANMRASDAAKLLVQSEAVGLDGRSVNAVFNFLRRQQESGVNRVISTRRTVAYAKRLVRSRAAMLARTNLAHMMNYGLQEAWMQAATLGRIDRNVRQEWVVDGDPCRFCLRLDGIRVRLGEPFAPGIYRPPDPHPNCMCMIVLWARSPQDRRYGRRQIKPRR